MVEQLNCYWSNARSCNISINEYEDFAFIIASNDISRIEIINKIKKIINDFNLKPKMAVELEENNNLTTFCDSICAYIRGSRINIVDLTAPLKQCNECDRDYEEPSVNVYWEYGYAAGLKKPLILICDEKQAEYIPFNILDKQILYYQEDHIEEQLGHLLKLRLEQPESEVHQREIKKRTEPLDIGKTTDALKTMGNGEMINIIRKSSHQELFELAENVMEVITQIEKDDELRGLYSFINILLKSSFTNDEFNIIFEVILKKFLEIPDHRKISLEENIGICIQKPYIKDWIKENKLLDDLIKVFIGSKSFELARINSGMIYPFVEELSVKQVSRILSNAITNDQIHNSFKTKPFIYAIVSLYRKRISMGLWVKLINKKLDSMGISVKQEFNKSGFRIAPAALHLLLNLDDMWEKVGFILKQIGSIPSFDGPITTDVLKKIKIFKKE